MPAAEESRRRLVLIDGSALAYRSFFAFIRNPLVNSRGENTSAVFGFANALLDVIDGAPDYLAVAFDTSAPTFRHKMYEPYKSTRAKMPDELAESLPRVRELVDRVGVPLLTRDGVEADDVIGTVASLAAAAGIDVEIVSGDKDFCQLVTKRVHVLRPRSGEPPERLDPTGVEARMGVRPDQVIDLLALMGDSSDNVPGVPGVGEKTAKKLIGEHGSLDAILEAADTIKGKLGERLREHADSALLSRRLVTIKTDVDEPPDLEALIPVEPDRADLFQLFQDLEFTRLAERFSAPTETREAAYHRVGSLDELDGWMTRLRDAGSFAFDTETTSLSSLDAELVGLAFSVDEAEGIYVPVGHEIMIGSPDVNLPLDAVLDAVRPVLEDPSIEKTLQHAKYDASVLLNLGIEVRGIAFDTLLAAYLLDPGRGRYGLDTLAMQELDHKMIAYTDLVGTGRKQIGIWQADIDRVTEYACEDADITLRLRNRFEPRLESAGVAELMARVELPLSNVLMGMERVGIRLDVDHLAGMSKTLTATLGELTQDIHGLAGRSFNVNSPAQLRTVLFDELGLPAGRRTKTGPSTDSDVLERLADAHPIASKILDQRQVSKLLSTYVDALPKLVRADTGRVHTSFNQTVAATGRLSSSDPNLQNIPIRTDVGREIRRAFVARDGWELLSVDYSQIELRVLASISGDDGLSAAFRDEVDVHRHTAATVFEVSADEVTSDMRARAKAVNFGVMYGQGARALAAQLGIPTAEAQSFIDAYFERYAAVQAFKTDTIDRARREGYVTTLLGRRRFLPEINSQHGQRRAYAERTAVNTVIQGTAADLIKTAMVNIAERLGEMQSAMLLQVHDELVFEAPPDERDALETLVRHEMETALELRVPVVADAGWGRTWLDAH